MTACAEQPAALKPGVRSEFVSGRNGYGPVPAPGALVGDRVTVHSGVKEGRTILNSDDAAGVFHARVTRDGQIVQLQNRDLSAYRFFVILDQDA